MSFALLSAGLLLSVSARAEVPALQAGLIPVARLAAPELPSSTTTLRLPPPAPGLRPAAGPRVSAAAGSDGTPLADGRGLFDGSGAKPNKDAHGLRFLGIELGGTAEQPGEDEPYARKGIQRYFDWDIRARAPLNGLGLRTNYRHPQGLRAFSLGFLKYVDWPGLWSGRDDLYGLVGSVPEKPLGGFQVGASAVLDAHWGANATYDRKEATRGERWSFDRIGSLVAGFSPLGDNGGKPWNFAVTVATTYETLARREPQISDERAGFGGDVGVAFQRALDKVPVPWLRLLPLVGNGVLRLDRLKTTVDVGESQLSTLAVNGALQLSFYLGRHLELTPGVRAQWRPAPDPTNPDETQYSWSGLLGFDINNLGF